MKFSILVIAKNEAQNLSLMVESVRSQGKDWEIILLEGGSTDNTQEVARSLGCKVYDQTDNIFSSLNKGLEYITGDIFTFFSGHDHYLPNAFDLVEKNIGDAMWLYGNISKGGKTTRFPLFNKEEFLKYNCPVSWCFIRTEAIKKYNLKMRTDLRALGEYDFYRQLAIYETPVQIQESLAYYKIHKNNVGRFAKSEKYLFR